MIEELAELRAQLELERVAKQKLERVLAMCERSVKEELERGYVLTYEPLAGNLWRNRWNLLLGRIEEALGH